MPGETYGKVGLSHTHNTGVVRYDLIMRSIMHHLSHTSIPP